MQAVQCVFREKPVLDVPKILARAQELLGTRLDSNNPSADAKAILIFHPETLVEFSDAKVPAQTVIFLPSDNEELEEPPNWEQELQQSWSCNNAAELVKGCRFTALVAEMMTAPLDPPVRVQLFHGVLQAVIEVAQPAALVFKHSQQVVAPASYLNEDAADPMLRPGSLNVRFFNIADSGGDMLMDTRGMHEIGLPDLQCHFRELDPLPVSRILYNTAYYIYQNGPVIESGNTIAGIEPGSKWRCQYEDSLVPPERELLDINPGPPYAAGGRAEGDDEEADDEAE